MGFKPSYGSLHRGGMKVCSESLDTIGIMTRSLADCALAMGAMTGRIYADPEAKRDRPPRLLLSLGHAPDAAAPETVALLHKAAAAARSAGAEVVEAPLPPALLAAAELHGVMMNMETRQGLAWEYAEARAQMSAVLLERMDWAGSLPAAKLGEARRAAMAARAAFLDWTAGYDAVLTPSAPGEAPEGLAYTGDATFNLLWTLLYGPNVTIPAGTGPAGLPLGVQLVGRIGEDPALLATARWVQSALG